MWHHIWSNYWMRVKDTPDLASAFMCFEVDVHWWSIFLSWRHFQFCRPTLLVIQVWVSWLRSCILAVVLLCIMETCLVECTPPPITWTDQSWIPGYTCIARFEAKAPFCLLQRSPSFLNLTDIACITDLCKALADVALNLIVCFHSTLINRGADFNLECDLGARPDDVASFYGNQDCQDAILVPRNRRLEGLVALVVRVCTYLQLIFSNYHICISCATTLIWSTKFCPHVLITLLLKVCIYLSRKTWRRAICVTQTCVWPMQRETHSLWQLLNTVRTQRWMFCWRCQGPLWTPSTARYVQNKNWKSSTWGLGNGYIF